MARTEDLKRLGMNIQVRHVKDLQEYPKNYNTHPDGQVAELGRSLTGPARQYKNIVVWNGFIIAGHGLVAAAKKSGVSEVAVNDVSHLSQEDAERLLVSDNVTATMALPDPDMLKDLLEGIPNFEDIPGLNKSWLDEWNVDLDLPGSEHEEDEKYTKKITAPIYEPKNEKPDIKDLFDPNKADALIEEIQAADIPEEERRFLIAAARRHTVFNFERIADYYAHSSPEVQDLMEKSALVIIDFDKAIEYGFVRLSDELAAQFIEEREDEG